MTDVRIFYTDEEDDDIFVGCDDEYKELIKIAAMKNKVWLALEVFDKKVQCDDDICSIKTRNFIRQSVW